MQKEIAGTTAPPNAASPALDESICANQIVRLTLGLWQAPPRNNRATIPGNLAELP